MITQSSPTCTGNLRTVNSTYITVLVTQLTLKEHPFNLARRVCTVVDDEESKISHLNKLQVTLQNQGYPKWLVNSSITEALKIPKQQQQKEREQKENQKQILWKIPTTMTSMKKR